MAHRLAATLAVPALLLVAALSPACRCNPDASSTRGSLAERAAAAHGEDAEKRCQQERAELLAAARSRLTSRWRFAELIRPLLQHCSPSKEKAALQPDPVATLPLAAVSRAQATCALVRALETGAVSRDRGEHSRGELAIVSQMLLRAPQLQTACAPELELSPKTRQLVEHLTQQVTSPHRGTGPRLQLHRAWRSEPVHGGVGLPSRMTVTVDVGCRPCDDGRLSLSVRGLAPPAEEVSDVPPKTRCATAEGWPADCADPFWSPFDESRRMLSTHVLELPHDAGVPTRVAARRRGPDVPSEPDSVGFEEGPLPELVEERVMPLFVGRSDLHRTSTGARYIVVLALVDAARASTVAFGSRGGRPMKVLHLLELNEALEELPPTEGRPFYVPFRLMLAELESDERDLPYSFSLHQPAPPGDVWLPAPLDELRLHPELLQRLHATASPTRAE